MQVKVIKQSVSTVGDDTIESFETQFMRQKLYPEVLDNLEWREGRMINKIKSSPFGKPSYFFDILNFGILL